MRTLILASLSTALVCASAQSADIYALAQTDGTTHFATQALDKNYVLVLRGQSEHPSNSSDSSMKNRGINYPLTVMIDRISVKHGIDAALVHAIIAVESQFNPNAMSPKGAYGAMQLMPATAQRYGVSDKTDPAQNIDAGVRYLKDLLHIHHDNLPLALAAYNAGEGSVSRHGRRIPPYRETMLYVPAVLARLHAYHALPKP